jgi:pimeloyl-ACP methyl ester carboxylesterase
MKRRSQYFLTMILILVVTFVFTPFLIPIPPLENVRPPRQLADPDSRFITVDGLEFHYKVYGEGEPAIILLHGFGSSLFTWGEIAKPLADLRTVIAYDRPAFGLTQRPLPSEWSGENPYSPSTQVNQLVGLMDSLGISKAILVGNSAGGTIAVDAALAHPERIEALVLINAAVYTSGPPRWLRPLLALPQTQHLGPLIARYFAQRGEVVLKSAWHDPSLMTAEIVQGYRLPMLVENWDRAIWEFTLASHYLDLAKHLEEIDLPVLVIAGDADNLVPVRQSRRLADALLNSELVVIQNCGHLPQEECPIEILKSISDFILDLPQNP